MELVFNIIKGVMIGIANVIPGVSGRHHGRFFRHLRPADQRISRASQSM